MPEFIKYPSIEQYRHVVQQVQHIARYEGYDEENNCAIINENAKMPTLTFTGTVKIHGTNAAVCLDLETGEVYAQSRKNVITPEKDNAGFAFFVESNKILFEIILRHVAVTNLDHGGKSPNKVITVFGEWCGGNIQKGVAVSELEKMFVIFGCKVDDAWAPLPQNISVPHSKVYSIEDFQTYSINIDFNDPQLAVNELIAITEQVEAECPVGKHFGVSGIGEGVVWSADYKGNHLKFKVKGEKHSSSKVKKLASIDVEKLDSIESFVEYSVTESRLNQAIEQVFTVEGLTPEIKKMGDFLRWIMSDIIKEEMDTLVENGLEPKDIGKSVSNKSRVWFMDYLDKQTFGG